MGGNETYPLYARNPVDAPQKVREGADLLPFVVGVHVLAKQHYLLHARRRKLANLFKYIGARPAYLPPPYIGDNAIAAKVVAPLHYRHVCLYPQAPVAGPHVKRSGGSRYRKSRKTALRSKPALTASPTRCIPAGPRAKIDERQTLGERLLLKLRDAAHHAEDKTLPFLQAPEPAHEAVEFLLRFLADAARIDDHDAGLLRSSCRLKAGRLEQAIRPSPCRARSSGIQSFRYSTATYSFTRSLTFRASHGHADP